MSYSAICETQISGWTKNPPRATPPKTDSICTRKYPSTKHRNFEDSKSETSGGWLWFVGFASKAPIPWRLFSQKPLGFHRRFRSSRCFKDDQGNVFLDVSCHVPWNRLEYSRKMFVCMYLFKAYVDQREKNGQMWDMWMSNPSNPYRDCVNIETSVSTASEYYIKQSHGVFDMKDHIMILFCLGKHAVSLRMDVVNL